MWLERISAPSVVLLRRLGTDTLARGLSGLLRAIYGRATRTETKAKRDVLLLSRREALHAQILDARRMHRPVKHLRREAYSITHEILARGK